MSQNVPLNQQNALPLATIAQATPGQILLLGGQVARYFGPTDTGINGSPFVSSVYGATTGYYLATRYLDLRGCTYFSVLLKREVTASLAAVASMQPAVQLRLTNTDTPPEYIESGATINNDLVGTFSIKTAAVFFPAAAAIGVVQRVMIAWGGMQAAQYGSGVSFGADARIIFRTYNNAVDPSNIFTCSVWAGS